MTRSATVAGDTMTAFAGGSVMVTGTLTCTAPLVAVTVAVPCACPVTSPVDDTSAMLPLSTVQPTGAPEMTAPFASFTVAVSCDVWPVVMVTLVGATAMLAATAAATAIPDVPIFPSLVAEMVVAPVDTPVTSPVLSTVAILSFDDDHVTVRPVSLFPTASSGSAIRCTVSPTLIAALDGVTRTDETPCGMTVIVEKPETPEALAAMRTVPTATPVTTPVLDTVAIAAFSVFQKTVAPDTGWPAPSTTDADSVTLAPSVRESVAGVTVMWLLPPGPVESPPHDRSATAQASAETNETKFNRRAARIEQLIVAGIPRRLACERARACLSEGTTS